MTYSDDKIGCIIQNLSNSALNAITVLALTTELRKLFRMLFKINIHYIHVQ